MTTCDNCQRQRGDNTLGWYFLTVVSEAGAEKRFDACSPNCLLLVTKQCESHFLGPDLGEFYFRRLMDQE